MSKIIVICGFSGAGKDTIAKYISEHYGYKMIVSTTSRPMRANESEGNPYHFIEKKEFQDLIANDELIEYRDYHTTLNGIQDTWYYGITKKTIDPDQNYVVVLDLLGLNQLKKYFNNTLSFFIEVSEDVRKNRAASSRPDFDITEWNRRLEDDKEKFSEKEIMKYVDFRVSNTDFYKCIETIMKEVDKCKKQ